MCKDKSVHDFHVNVYVMSLLVGRIIAIRRDILLSFEELLLRLMNIPVVLMVQNGTSFFILEKQTPLHFLLLYKLQHCKGSVAVQINGILQFRKTNTLYFAETEYTVISVP